MFPAFAQQGLSPLLQKRWYETRTAHFDIYSCANLADANKLAAKLEQFCKAYSLLAGTQAVASPPTVVMAFPDHETMKPFLPVYNGQPANIAGFFTRGADENLIVLGLNGTNAPEMEVIFHEYAHLLFRRNDRIWPIWLTEGMAEIYSTFETTGYRARIAKPIDYHLYSLKHQPWMPLPELFSVTRESPQYNERDRQGIFYAESWLLTHYLMAGDNPAFKARFGRFTQLLVDGQTVEQAFTNAVGVSLPAMETALHGYLARGEFKAIDLPLASDISSPILMTSRVATPVETYFRLGDELLRIDQADMAERYFAKSQQLAPMSPLPYEGLGLLEAQRGQHRAAADQLKAALQHGSTNFLAHYLYAREKLRMTSDSDDRYRRVDGDAASEIRKELQQSVALMPDFGPSHETLGFFEMVQGDDLPAAEQQLQRAMQLEPENSAYLLSLAQLQILERNLAAAKQTLAPLLLPSVDPGLRASAEELVKEIGREKAK